MFKLVLTDPSIFKTCFEAINAIVEEVKIEVDTEGLRLNAMDRSHITFVHLDLKESLFDIYECDQPLVLNLDTEALMKVLKRSKSDDVMELTTEDGQLVITFEGRVKKIFKVKLIDSEYDARSPPDIEYPVSIGVPIDVLKETIQDIEIVAERIKIGVDEDNLVLEADGDFSDARVEYLHGEKVDQDVQSTYSIDGIKKMLKADKFADNTSLEIGTDMPLTLKLELLNEEGCLSFLLAPRIEDE